MDTMNQGTLARWILENNENLKNNPKYQVEFTINEYNLNKTHPYYDIINVASHESFRKIHTSHEMFDFINTNNYHKKYNNSPFPYTPWVYNEETFYNAYPDFDLAYYKNRYRKDIVETKLVFVLGRCPTPPKNTPAIEIPKDYNDRWPVQQVGEEE